MNQRQRAIQIGTDLTGVDLTQLLTRLSGVSANGKATKAVTAEPTE